ncbi:NADP-dependent oxidoreductase domain-containing protein [Mycena floridula]|nr:NADP-dependent oxidoreductase domain-containing protein [Mycena floridula]
MSVWTIPPPPDSKLKRYRVLSPLAGVRVSPIQLGAMSIGDKWSEFMGSMDKEASWKLLDAFFAAGGNFIDTANNYQDESSEEFVGEWAETRGIRDQLVIATKYSTGYKRGDPSVAVKSVFAGNNMKSMHMSVNASLKKLRTSYIDIFYMHWYDYTTGVEEIMNGLHTLVTQGKVLYLGVSDCPAWIVAKANQYARDHGKTPFCVYQGQWNVMERSFERDIIPMARAEGLALAPWGVLAGGKIRTDAEEQRRKESGENGRTMMGPDWERTDKEKQVCKVLEEIAAEIGVKHINAVAIAYVMHRTPYVFPILGGRKVEQLHDNLEALEISLTPDHMKRIEAATPIDLGFPHAFTGTGEGDGFFMAIQGTFDLVPARPVITPAKN